MNKKDSRLQPSEQASNFAGNPKKVFAYEDIVNLPHPVSKRHTPMPMINRAAQFAPFAALTGYDAAIEETARLTEDEITLSENEVARLNDQLQQLIQHLPEHPEVKITWFRPDERKSGGAYITTTGTVKKIDEFGKYLLMDSGEMIPMEQMMATEMMKVMYDENKNN